jgi:hypothetical protein
MVLKVNARGVPASTIRPVARPKIRPSSSSTSTSEDPPMSKPAEIVAALGDVSDIESYATLQAQMVELFTCMADGMKDWNDERSSQIFRKMAATVETVPYEMLAEFGHNYDPALIAAVLILQISHDYADAHDLVLTLLDELRMIDLDRPDAQKAIEEVEVILKSMGRPNPQSDR